MFENDTIRKIYEAIGDEISKKIFASRLLYSLTEDSSQLSWMTEDFRKEAESNKKWLTLKNKILRMKEKPYLFGAGAYGRLLFEQTGGVKTWEGLIDNFPGDRESIWGVPLLMPERAVDAFGRNFVISSKAFLEEMRSQLSDLGIENEYIIDGTAWYDATEGRQYFDLPYLECGDREVFVDGGCCDGMTAANFSNLVHGTYKKIYCFEPDHKNIQKIRRNFASRGIERYELIEMGLWDTREELAFAGNGSADSHIVENAESDLKIKGIPLDDILNGKRVSFIKMDIEGAEKKGLKGAWNTIKTYKPKLAVCVYHRPEDIWELPEMILRMCPDYRLYFRHYSCGSTETVLYAL